MTISEEQLRNRHLYIGGSDAPAIAGVSQFQQPLDVYLSKIQETEPVDLSDNERVIFGNLFEEPVAQEFSRRTGMKVRNVNSTLRHKHYDFMVAHIDKKIEGANEGLEVKTRGIYAHKLYGPSGTDQVMESDIIQCAHYMMVTGYERWHLAVLLSGQEMRYYTIERDEQLIQTLLDIELDFWALVRNETPPDLDFQHRSTAQLLNEMYPGTDGEVIDMTEEALQWHRVLEDAKQKAKIYEGVIEGAKWHLRSLMGDAAIARLPFSGGFYTRKKVIRKGYTVEPSDYINFRHTNKAPKGADK